MKYYAFNEEVQQEYINELLKEHSSEELTTEFLETLLEYEYRDNN